MNYIQRPKRESLEPADCRMAALGALMCTLKHAVKASEPGVRFCSEGELQPLMKHLSHRSAGG